jgi:hypothetical protein
MTEETATRASGGTPVSAHRGVDVLPEVAVVLSGEGRKRLAALADAMIPAGDGLPSASQAGVAGGAVDRLLGVRPDLLAPLRAALEMAPASMPVERAIATLRTEHPETLAALGEIVAGAYFLNPEVAQRIGYHGRAAIPVDIDVDTSEAVALRRPVVERGRAYRPDPRSEALPG